MKPKSSALSTLALIVLLSSGCHKQLAAVHPPSPPATASPVAQPIVNHTTSAPQPVRKVTEARVPDAVTKTQIQDLLNRIQDVYFDYDQHALRLDAQSTLQADATTLREILKQYPNYKLTVEGYCDERGSDAYNLALGDERATKAKEFLESLGLPAAQLNVVSYGKEKPICTDHDEDCWRKNRRAHISQDQKAS